MKIAAPPSDIQIIAYIAINRIQNKPNDDNKISSYTRSFRYESPDPLASRRLAFNKLWDEKMTRLYGEDYDPIKKLNGLSLLLEYMEPVEGRDDKMELKKLYLFTGDPEMSALQQLQSWEKELQLLQMAYPEESFPKRIVEYIDGREFLCLETTYWTRMYYFYV